VDRKRIRGIGWWIIMKVMGINRFFFAGRNGEVDKFSTDYVDL
jgi:hypothetical protein